MGTLFERVHGGNLGFIFNFFFFSGENLTTKTRRQELYEYRIEVLLHSFTLPVLLLLTLKRLPKIRGNSLSNEETFRHSSLFVPIFSYS